MRKVNYLDNSLSYYTFNIWIVTVNPPQPASDGKEIGKEASASEEKIDAPVSTTIATVSALVRKNDVKESPLSNLPEPGYDGAPG